MAFSLLAGACTLYVVHHSFHHVNSDMIQVTLTFPTMTPMTMYSVQIITL